MPYTENMNDEQNQNISIFMETSKEADERGKMA